MVPSRVTPFDLVVTIPPKLPKSPVLESKDILPPSPLITVAIGRPLVTSTEVAVPPSIILTLTPRSIELIPMEGVARRLSPVGPIAMHKEPWQAEMRVVDVGNTGAGNVAELASKESETVKEPREIAVDGVLPVGRGTETVEESPNSTLTPAPEVSNPIVVVTSPLMLAPMEMSDEPVPNEEQSGPEQPKVVETDGDVGDGTKNAEATA